MENAKLIRVLHVIATLDPAGAERQLTHLCTRLDRRRFLPGVCCLTRGGPLERVLAEAGVPVWILHKHGKWDLGVLLRLRGVIKEFRPQVLHTWLPTANTLGRLAVIGCNVPVRIAAERAADIWKGLLRRLTDRILERRTTCIVCNAEAVGRFLVDRIGLHAEKIVVIRNGLDLNEFDAAARAGISMPLPEPPGRPLIGTVARLEPQKGVAFLIEAFARLAQRFGEAELWIVGDGPDQDSLRAQATAAGVADRVQFLGMRDDVPALLAQFDLFVLPSLWEGLPNAVIEAMAARRAVVATRVDGTPELVVDGATATAEEPTALLAPPKDAGALAEAMERILDDEELRRRLGEAGRGRIETAFTMEGMVEEMQSLYDTLLTGCGK